MKIIFTPRIKGALYGTWQVFCAVSQSVYSYRAYDLEFGVIKFHRFDASSGYKPRMEGEIRMKGRDYNGFRITVEFDLLNNAAMSLHFGSRYHHYVLPLIPRVNIRTD